MCLLLTSCSEDEQKATEEETITATSEIEVLFPITESLTTASSITVRGTASSDINSVSVNGVDGDFQTYAGFWTAEIPLQFGYNNVNISYSTDSSTQSFNTNRIRRNSSFYDDPILASYADNTNSIFIYESDTNSLIYLNLTTQQSVLTRQFQVEDQPDDVQSKDEMHEQKPLSITASANGDKVYYYTEFNNDYYINLIETNSGDVTTLYGPDSPSYDASLFVENFPLILDEVNNQLILTKDSPSDPANALNLISNTFHSLNIPDLSTQAASSAFLHWAMKDSNTLTYIAKTGSTYFSGNVDIATGNYSNYSGLLSLVDDCPEIDNRSQLTYAVNQTLYYWADSDKLCYLDTTNYTIEEVTNNLEGYPNTNLINLDFIYSYPNLNRNDEDYLLVKGASNIDYQLVQFDSGYHYSLIGDFIEVGDGNISPTTARETLLDLDSGKIYYIIREDENRIGSQIFVMDTANQEWSEIGTYPDVRFEIAVLNEQENAIYAYNDRSGNDNELYRIDLVTGVSTIVVGATEKSTVDYPDFNVDSIAFDEQNQIIYLARDINEAVPTGYGTFSLLAWNIATQSLTEVASISNQANATNMRASYDMVFIPESQQVAFYHSTSDYPIWTVNVLTGARSILSIDNLNSGPSTSNARGLAIDTSKNRIIVASQASQSLFSIDLNTGDKTMTSAEDHAQGIVLLQVIGIDVDHNKQIALVADESIEALYYVDLMTGERVIIQN
ncbi:hypothetical protein VII00023_19089 [Vibrio ichthyoenteri ATCC 700023]|uniref:Uncharacterized protein n=2 Tax=Vibrio ichthyoenteri TaxID=142461 RepID=F9RZD8_9VIBR|nr:hypothetical protein VII00023_19089 [Vibrio ichthyoenteri ATCC 700023]